MHLVGVDIGFSQSRRSNGIAVFRDGKLLRTERLSVEERNQALRSLRDVDVVAIDAPLLPSGTADTLPRECERMFSRGRFQKRCKPGMSHVRGTGQLLRAHGRRAADELALADSTVVEAFPNAFLGVVIPDLHFANMHAIRRGGKFDWLYDKWIELDLFDQITAAAQLPAEIADRCVIELNHDIRAALICLLTAAFAAIGTCSMIGTPVDGYFYLPPREMWADWART